MGDPRRTSWEYDPLPPAIPVRLPVEPLDPDTLAAWEEAFETSTMWPLPITEISLRRFVAVARDHARLVAKVEELQRALWSPSAEAGDTE
jgi:hypothetical protein